jgi:predicted sulfurtransferase
MSRGEQDKAISFCHSTLSSLGMTGRLRVAKEGFNSTLTGSHSAVREFAAALREFNPGTFSHTDFKYVDGLPSNQLLKGLKVWPVSEIVTYGFDPNDAPLEKRGVHLSPAEFHKAMMSENSVVIDVRNFNETLIGKFKPPTHTLSSDAAAEKELLKPLTGKKRKKKEEKDIAIDTSNATGEGGGCKVLDPCMRRSTEFPAWVESNKAQLEGKQVLMYCTAGVRCERASAFLRNIGGIENVCQLEGGIHRYLDAFPEDGGFWVGKNYTFDKRFNHGAATAEVISSCVHCHLPWDRYQAQKKCANKKCSMEVLLCK